MPRVFITSREGDADGIARRLEHDLINAFGFDNVLTERIRVQPGLDVRGELARRITHSHAVLVVIGRFWESDARLQDSTDPVRLSIELGLKAVGLRVIPILVEGAVMPLPESLPPSLADLAHRSSLAVREKPDYQGDLERLITHIEENVVEDSTYASTPARIATLAKPPAELEARMQEQFNDNAVIERAVDPQTKGSRGGFGIFGFFGKIIGGFFGFIGSLISTALHQMVRSTVSFIMGIVLTVLVLIMVVLLAIAIIQNNFDFAQTLAMMQEQIGTWLQSLTAGG